jgi:rare lipoprotein A
MITAKKRVHANAARIRNALLGLIIVSMSALIGSPAHAGDTQTSASKAAASKTWRDANASVGPNGRFTGMASYYGNESGNKTASGAPFDQNAMTAAHKTLPFGTKLKVTHGDRSVVVTVNDRGPFVAGRVLDLSTAAARAIGLTGAGVGRVVAEVQ